MWKTSIVILLISICAADEIVEPEQCNGPPPFDFRMSPDSCCKKPIFKPDIRDCLNKTRQVIVKRYHDGQVNKDDEKVAGDDGCFSNCFSKNDIFKNDEINRDELVKSLESQTEDSAWSSIHSAAVDKCIEVLQPDLKDIKNAKDEQKCNRVAVLMLLCLNGQYFTRCPETHFQNDNENCKKFQEHIKTCPMPRMGPWGRGKKGFGGRKGGPRFGPGPNFGPGHGFGSHFEGGPFGHGPHNFGHGPNFGLGQAFGFL